MQIWPSNMSELILSKPPNTRKHPTNFKKLHPHLPHPNPSPCHTDHSGSSSISNSTGHSLGSSARSSLCSRWRSPGSRARAPHRTRRLRKGRQVTSHTAVIAWTTNSETLEGWGDGIFEELGMGNMCTVEFWSKLDLLLKGASENSSKV